MGSDSMWSLSRLQTGARAAHISNPTSTTNELGFNLKGLGKQSGSRALGEEQAGGRVLLIGYYQPTCFWGQEPGLSPARQLTPHDTSPTLGTLWSNEGVRKETRQFLWQLLGAGVYGMSIYLHSMIWRPCDLCQSSVSQGGP